MEEYRRSNPELFIVPVPRRFDVLIGRGKPLQVSMYYSVRRLPSTQPGPLKVNAKYSC